MFMLKFFTDREKLIKIELDRTKKALDENLDKLPNEELPFMEPHLRSLYFQAYFLLAYEFYNASLVLSGILLESLTKEVLFNNGVGDEQLEKMDFGNAISECRKRSLLEDSELNFLEEKKDTLRNPYLHFNQIRLTRGLYVRGWKIPIEDFKASLEKVKLGKLTGKEAVKDLIKGKIPELVDSKSFRPVATILKGEVDKKICFPIFLEIDKFVREFAKKYFSPK
jgi:hypothetical protein